MRALAFAGLALGVAEARGLADSGLDPGRERRAQYSGRVSVTGALYTEQELSPAGAGASLAMPGQILLGDLRLRLDGQNVAGRLAFRADVRLRATADLDFERKFQEPAGSSLLSPIQASISARGYLGGPEYDLRELFVGVRITARSQLQLGRLVVSEADALKLDGARVQLVVSPAWELSLFGGAYPNPYSRSLLTDYEPPCGAGVASGSQVLNLGALDGAIVGPTAATPLGCDRLGPQLSLTGGGAARYQYDRLKLWGSASVVGTFFGGPGDGGPAVVDASVLTALGNLRPAGSDLDSPRVYVSWVNQITPSGRFALYSDLVVDLLGSRGAQLSRAAVVANLRPLASERMTMRMTYSYMSPIAIGMFLSRALYNRSPNGTSLGGIGIVENNLTILRTARHDARLNLDGILTRRLQIFAEGRLRLRSLLDAEQNPAVYQTALYTDNERALAGDASIGLRDGGSLRGLKFGAVYSFLQGFRAQNHLLRFSIGAALWQSRIAIDAEYVALLTRDLGADDRQCDANLSVGLGQAAARLDPAQSLFLAGCFGRRTGTTHEAGATLSLLGTSAWFFYLDYRFTALLSDPSPQLPSSTNSTVLGHGVLARVELSFAK